MAEAITPTVNPSSLEPLYAPWAEPDRHRVRADKAGEPAKTIKGRRRSSIEIAQNLRAAVREWREAYYVGASDTTRQLLGYWFERPHRATTPSGDEFEFRYYFCQREAVECFIYLYEVRGLRCLSQVTAEFGGADAEIAALGITEDEDLWARYAFKLATGAGKTKCMSLAIVWSYFHALRESDSPMARHFVVIAPNLTVYERLKEDFGDGRIFDNDPLIPPEWRGDWNMSTVLQDEASGAATGGTLYLTNIHRLYDPSRRAGSREAETYDWMGPSVSKANAMDTGQALRERITAHKRVMVLNDEAHHLWDPGSAWNDAIRFLHDSIKSRTGGCVAAQLDFSATPKDNSGRVFKHVVCDTPLGEAVDAGIVKTPIIGKSSTKLTEEPSDDASYRWDRHLRLGYARWAESRKEWEGSEKKAILFVMCEDTKAADEITRRMNTDPTFELLNGKTINLHTNLKGKMKKKGRGANAYYEFVENEKEISDDDLKQLRELSRQLDSNSSPYLCIVSVLMLREGWDVRNVTTIVPLRPYTSKANILPEQTLGRGLRRMTPPGEANEVVAVVEHPAFASLYQHELAQEGLPIEAVDIDNIPATTVSIYPDEKNKDLQALEIEIPTLTQGHRTKATLEGLTIDDVRNEFKKYQPLPLGAMGKTEVDYEGRHLFTNEVVESTKFDLPLLKSGIGAVSYFVKQMENVCKVRGLHQSLAPLLQEFLETILFVEPTSLFDAKCISRLGDSDVAEHTRAVFVPLIRARITTTELRTPSNEPMRLSFWKPFQVTHSERKPTRTAKNTLFNLVPCDRSLEEAMVQFTDRASDVAAFAKNAGPQCLRIDYLGMTGRLSFYRPDFFVRMADGRYLLVETKGREDRDVPIKARAAIAWCEAASTKECPWEYVYVPQGVFEQMRGDTMDELVRSCRPSREQLVQVEEDRDKYPLLAAITEAEGEAEKTAEIDHVVPAEVIAALPSRYRRAVEQATELFRFFERKEDSSYCAVFTPLLGSIDEACKALLKQRVGEYLPESVEEQKLWFTPYMDNVDRKSQGYYQQKAQNFKRTLVFDNGLFPLGLMCFALDYALNEKTKIGGVFEGVRTGLRFEGSRKLLATASAMNDFRNKYVAHQEEELNDGKLARAELQGWIEGLRAIHEAVRISAT